MINHAVTTPQRNPPDAHISIYPSTLVLIIENSDLRQKKTSVFMASVVIQIDPMWRAMGKTIAKALTAFHAFIRADNTDTWSLTGR